jgi:hypothetical protein
VRFGKQNKTWAAFGRKLFGENSPSAPECPVEEETACADEAPVPEMEEQVMPEDPFTPQPGTSNDPSQAVLISLGRFKRHIQHATGAPEHAQWPGECLQELLKILNIAAESGWDTLREAVTDTARVLCSYERARRTAHCLPFLRACDDALSMMIGDIIIDNETPTVRMAWQKHYQGALEVMRRDGIALVEDEVAEDEPARETAVAPPAVPAAPAPEPAPAPVAEPEAPARNLPDEPFGGVPGEAAAAPEESADDDTGAPVSPWEDDADAAPEEEPLEDDAPQETDDEAPVEEDLGEIDLRGDVAEEESAQDDPDTGPAAADEETDNAPGDTGTPDEAPAPDHLEEHAVEKEEGDEDETSDEVTAEAPAEEPAPEPEPPAPPTVDEINKAMQSAILAGDVAGAKVLALHLAAALARQEADHVSAALDGARSRLGLNGDAAEDAARRVREAEERVRSAEEQIAAREADALEARTRLGALDGGIAETRGELEDLDARIAALQEERAAAAQRLRDQEIARTDTIAAESLVSSEIEALMEEEEAAREFLEKARGRVADLEEGRRGILGDILALETELEERRRAIGEITRPLDGDGAPAEAGQPDGGLLI